MFIPYCALKPTYYNKYRSETPCEESTLRVDFKSLAHPDLMHEIIF